MVDQDKMPQLQEEGTYLQVGCLEMKQEGSSILSFDEFEGDGSCESCDKSGNNMFNLGECEDDVSAVSMSRQEIVDDDVSVTHVTFQDVVLMIDASFGVTHHKNGLQMVDNYGAYLHISVSYKEEADIREY